MFLSVLQTHRTDFTLSVPENKECSLWIAVWKSTHATDFTSAHTLDVPTPGVRDGAQSGSLRRSVFLWCSFAAPFHNKPTLPLWESPDSPSGKVMEQFVLSVITQHTLDKEGIQPSQDDDLDEGIECMFSKSANETKLC